MQRLNSDGQQFYQYKQNEHTPPILTHDVGYTKPDLGQAQTCVCI